MKYIREFGIIIVISLIGELLNYLIPLPIPSSIYGLVIMFLCLHFKIVKIADVKKTAVFLIKPNVIAYAIITIVSTVLVMAVAGRVTQWVIRHSKKGDKE